jgi:hypothetical protein
VRRGRGNEWGEGGGGGEAWGEEEERSGEGGGGGEEWQKEGKDV